MRSHVPLLPAVSLPLSALAGTTLRENTVTTRDQPPFDRVMMDGIALAWSAFENGCRRFHIAGIQAAGSAPLHLRDPRSCIEVMTGAMLPAGCDCVVPVEKIDIDSGTAVLQEGAAPVRRMNIHTRGLDARRGDPLLKSGTLLGAAEVAALAANGYAQALVSRPPRIMMISTGNELVEPGEPLADWQIHRSNIYGLWAALRRHGYSQLAQDHLPDDLSLLRTRLRAHLDAHDALILSGGVSMGRFDFVPQVMRELGVTQVFHKIAQRPGKPMWFGVGAGGQAVYALPGNPVSTLMCLTRYVFRGLEAAAGTPASPLETIALAQDLPAMAVTRFVPVRIGGFALDSKPWIGEHGDRCEKSGLPMDLQAPAARPRPTQGSGDFTSLIGTDGFVELPPAEAIIAQGTRVPLHRW
ncbi:molybdopterin molybdotransferase [Steroidobacter denitrificans]|uniref:Molybdopterin molybdenumtransferase n=1 Tax=Steroidobacter denitrificans TaxID=465721 RepID=A0A127F8U3_STEDE|nr:molybdopterin molybdotransferase [Steroidobacter denitrificans]